MICRFDNVLVFQHFLNELYDIENYFVPINAWLLVYIQLTLWFVDYYLRINMLKQVRMRPPYAQWRYKLDVLVDSRPIYFDRYPQKIQHFPGVTVYTPSNILNQSHVIIMFQSGAGVEVFENKHYMAATVYLPQEFINQTRG